MSESMPQTTPMPPIRGRNSQRGVQMSPTLSPHDQVKSELSAAINALLDDEIARSKEEAQGLVRRDMGRVMAVAIVVDEIVDTVRKAYEQ